MLRVETVPRWRGKKPQNIVGVHNETQNTDSVQIVLTKQVNQQQI